MSVYLPLTGLFLSFLLRMRGHQQQFQCCLKHMIYSLRSAWFSRTEDVEESELGNELLQISAREERTLCCWDKVRAGVKEQDLNCLVSLGAVLQRDLEFTPGPRFRLVPSKSNCIKLRQKLSGLSQITLNEYWATDNKIRTDEVRFLDLMQGHAPASCRGSNTPLPLILITTVRPRRQFPASCS